MEKLNKNPLEFHMTTQEVDRNRNIILKFETEYKNIEEKLNNQ